MTAIPIEPLRKRHSDGTLYIRLPEIEAKTKQLGSLSREELIARCKAQESDTENYVPSECLLTLVRQHRSQPLDACAEMLFKTLIERLLRKLPRADSCHGENEDLTQGNVRDEAKFHFLEMLSRDRQGEYVEQLDYYEIRFAGAVKALRIDAERKVYRRQDRLVPLETESETGEFSPKVLKAIRDFDPFPSSELQNLDYVPHLNAAISELPAIQKAIVEMIRKGIPIESNEPGKLTISSSLKKTPKTIAAHRDKAFASLRAKLMKREAV